jgi:hypothetical protein
MWRGLLLLTLKKISLGKAGTMATRQNLLDELNWITDKISSGIWTVNFGVLGTAWALLVGSDTSNRFRLEANDVKWVFILCLGGLLGELLQYLSGYINSRMVLSAIESENKTEFQYDKSAFWYRARGAFFYAKIVLTLLGAGFLLYKLYLRLAS